MVINHVVFTVELMDIINELKTQLDINGIKMLAKYRESPEDVQVCCPYHNNGQEHRPSAGIRKTDGLFHCFACGEIHSLQEVISAYFQKDDITGAWGWNWLLKNFATLEVEERKDVRLDFARSNSNFDVSGNNSIYNRHLEFISEEELEKYRYIHPYMYKRKLTDEIIELFDIGYDKKTKCLTFPVRDIFGHTLFIARRSVHTKFFNYPSGVEKPLYGIYELSRLERYPDEVMVCESMLDALTCWVYGRYAVALNGLGNDLQINQLSSLPCRKLILATDNDEAGRQARKRLKTRIKTKLVTEYIFPNNRKDVNELLLEEFNNLEEVF